MKHTANEIALALLISSNVVVVFAHAWLGASSQFTGVYLVATTGILIVLGRWHSLFFADLLWLGLCGLVGVSAIQHAPAILECALVILSLAAYPASRGVPGAMQGRAFVLILVVLVGLGSLLTLVAFGTEATKLHGRPLIFGLYDHVLSQFALLLSLLLFAFACSRTKIGLVAPIFVAPSAILAAAQVRFVFVALISVLVLGSTIASQERRRFLAIAGLVIASVLLGAIWKRDATVVYAKYAAQSIGATASPSPPDAGCSAVNANNSVDVRLQIYREAIAVLPEAGLLGIGLGRFAQKSCLGSEVHNTVLQAAIELGIPAGLALVGLIVAVWTSLFRLVGQSFEVLFALCALSFAVMLSTVYGTLASAGFLFMTLGYGVATSTKQRTSKPAFVPPAGAQGRECAIVQKA